jgi:nitroreductase
MGFTLLTTTRAVRKRLDLTREVPRPLIEECIQIACQGPTGGNVQKWRWLVVTDPDKKAAIAELYARAYAPYIASQRAAVEKVGRRDANAIMSSSDHLAEVRADVPVHVIPIGLDRLPANASTGAMTGYFGSLLPAVWSFMLAARSRGLGTVWTTLHLEYEAEAAQILGIPDSVTQLALIPLAYYTGDDFKAGTRKDATAVTYWDTWGHKA